MGDALREAAFDAAYEVLGDVAEAEDYATEVVARMRRSRRRQVGLGAAAVVLLVLAATVAVARGEPKPIVHAAARAPTGVVTDETTTTEATTSTTAVLMQPPIETPAAAPVSRPTTATTARPAPPTTVGATVAPAPSAAPGPVASLAADAPPNADPRRIYVSARGQDPDGYVSRMSIDWGDGTPDTNFDYPLALCQSGILQAANANHAYAVAGTYTVRLIVTSVGCDGTGSRSAGAEVPVIYPSSG